MTTQQEALDARPADVVVGETIHLLARRAGLNVRALAALMGVQEVTLGRKLNGKRGWQLWELQRAAAALNVEVADLISGLRACRDSNPKPSDWESTARTVLCPWCNHVHSVDRACVPSQRPGVNSRMTVNRTAGAA